MPQTFVGSRVRQLRSERDFSQAALALDIDEHRSTVSPYLVQET